MATTAPTLRYERELLRSRADWTLLGGIDEVGRGALAGPVSVGLVVVELGTRTAPPGVRDSKLLTPAAREAVEPRLRRWGLARAVGHASPAEIDAIGIVGALRLAGQRALAEVVATGYPPSVLLLDGSHDWFTPPDALGLFAETADGDAARLPVVTRVKADMCCASVAAASVLAKVERDAMMRELAASDPVLDPYGLAANKGYSAPGHIDALRRLGPTAHHRRSWRLPGVADGAAADSAVDLGHNGAPRHEGKTRT